MWTSLRKREKWGADPPQGSALVLLKVVAEEPDIVLRALASQVQRQLYYSIRDVGVSCNGEFGY